jgi:type I restriction enzyme S subunit
MSRLDDLLYKLCPNGVKQIQLGEKCKVLRGKRLTKKELSDDGIYPVFHGGLIPLGRYHEFNRKAKQTMIINTGSVGEVVWSDVDFWSSDGTFVIETPEDINDKFLYYYLKTQESFFKTQKREGGVPTIDRNVVERKSIPIPPIEIQNEIVQTLDLFTTLEAELEAELEARKTQYTHYRDSLLRFEGKDVEWKTLGELGEFTRGKRFVKTDIVPEGVPCIHYGEMYTHYKIWAKEAKSFLEPELAAKLRVAKKGDVIIVAAGETIEDIGQGVAWHGDEDVVIHDACFSFSHNMHPNYVSHFTQTDLFHSQIKRYISSGKISSINAAGLSKAKIPVPPMEEQIRIASILDKFHVLINDISVGIPAEIEGRRKQYEYYRNRLLTFKEVVSE